MNENEYSFGPRLVQLRQNAGLSQQGLADRLSVTRQAVSNWERGQTLPDLDTLRSIAQVLGTDLNTLGGSAVPVPKQRMSSMSKGLWGGALVLCFCGVLFLGGYLATQEIIPSKTAQTTPLAPHRTQYQYTTSSGTTVTVNTPADGRKELADLLAALPEREAGPVEVTAELADTFCYFADQYDLQFVPEYREGEFTSSWDQVLFWLYKAGISKGGIMSEELVDDAMEDFFGSTVRYSHQSTEHFPIIETGYYPVDVTSTKGGPYVLTSLMKLEDGAYEAALRQKSGSTVTLTLALGESLQFHAITRRDETV